MEEARSVEQHKNLIPGIYECIWCGYNIKIQYLDGTESDYIKVNNGIRGVSKNHVIVTNNGYCIVGDELKSFIHNIKQFNINDEVVFFGYDRIDYGKIIEIPYNTKYEKYLYVVEFNDGSLLTEVHEVLNLRPKENIKESIIKMITSLLSKGLIQQKTANVILISLLTTNEGNNQTTTEEINTK